jgi:hypothetical protein
MVFDSGMEEETMGVSVTVALSFAVHPTSGSYTATALISMSVLALTVCPASDDTVAAVALRNEYPATETARTRTVCITPYSISR